MMRETALFLSALPVMGVKIHLLYIVKGTQLADLYEEGKYSCLERDEYVELVVDFLEHIPPPVVIQRLTGDPVGSELVAPLWEKGKSTTLKRIRERLKEKDTWQGKKITKSR